MEEKKVTYQTIDEYIALFPTEIQEIMENLRRVIKEAAPEATEKISWQMPTFFLQGNLVHFAAFKRHIGFYAGENGVAHFLDELSEYKNSKGAIQFPIDKPLPYELVKRIVMFRVTENMSLAEEKKAKKIKKSE
ncbi:MAG: hypothetical protein K0S47_1270 [Herbinix sp.]|jgi:uncharacterized protein YdhG (YjbR/CyaY superfamily)|nr:hypothetical protein [Herbinix sp.]